jgi:hypothetical protein
MKSTLDQILAAAEVGEQALVVQKPASVAIFISPDQREMFLERLLACGSLRAAAVGAGILYPRIAKEIARNNDFKIACVEAMEYYKANLEQQVIHKALTGIVQKRYDGDGVLVETIVKDDPRLLLRLMERFNDDWKSSKAEVNVNVQNNIDSASKGSVLKLAQMLDIKLVEDGEDHQHVEVSFTNEEFAEEVKDETHVIESVEHAVLPRVTPKDLMKAASVATSGERDEYNDAYRNRKADTTKEQPTIVTGAGVDDEDGDY